MVFMVIKIGLAANSRVLVHLQVELDVDSDTPGPSTGNRVRRNSIVPQETNDRQQEVNLVSSLSGSQPEAWCGLGCESMARSMQRAAVSNDGLPRFRSVPPARGYV